jgi:uncharacterized protein
MSTIEGASQVLLCDTQLIIGFIRVEEDGRTLILPDYSGNLFYSTLGAIESDRISSLS